MERYDIGKLPRACDFKPVIVHHHTNVIAAHSVVAVRYCVHESLEPSKFWILWYDFELAVISKILEFPELARDELLGILYCFGKWPVEGTVFDDVESAPGFHFVAIEADDTYSSPRHELGRVC